MGYLFSTPLLFAVALPKSESATGIKVAEWLLLVSGLILLWGAAGEYLEDHQKLHKLPRWLQWTKLVFVLMVVGGLIGEFIGGISASGITVLTHIGASAQEEQAANALVSALQASGLATGRNGAQFTDDLPAALTGTWDTSKTARIRIVIGAKQ